MFYNFKSDDLIQDVVIECICPIVYDLMDEYHYLRRDENLSIYAPSYIAKEILGRLLSEENLEEFEEADSLWVNEDSDIFLLYNENEEVVITIGYDGMIFVETARTNDGRILRSESALCYVYDEFSHKDVEKLSNDEFSVLVFGFKDECEDTESYDEECCENCCRCDECCVECDVCGCKQEDDLEELCDDNNEDDIHDVAVKSEEQYFVNGKSVSKDEYEKFSKEFHEKMKEFMDFMNRRIFFHW